jgi:hypothetical protein
MLSMCNLTKFGSQAGVRVHKMLSFLVSSQTARPFVFFPVGLHGVTDESRALTAFFETCMQMTSIFFWAIHL